MLGTPKHLKYPIPSVSLAAASGGRTKQDVVISFLHRGELTLVSLRRPAARLIAQRIRELLPEEFPPDALG